MKASLKIGISGVRGIVGESFTPQIAAKFAQALGTFVGGGDIFVGRDTRPSGPMIEWAVLAGLLSVGCKPVLLGVMPTPSLLFQVRHRGARGGIVITASHNGGQWNALKFVDRRGMFFDTVHAEELFDIYHQQDFPMVAEGDLRRVAKVEDAIESHFDRILTYVDAEAIRKRRFRLAVDCCNGVGGVYTPRFLHEHLHCQVTPLFAEPTGVFEREPEPLAEHLGRLCETIKNGEYDIGFAQDPDGDRLAVVDEQGRAIGEQITVALAVKAILALHGKGPVAANLSSGKSIERVVEKEGCPLIRTRTGEVHVTEAILRAGAVAGGEHTGGIIIPAIHPCRDSYGGMAVILEYMAHTGRSVSDLCRDIPTYALIKERVPITADRAPRILRRIRRAYQHEKLIFLDGVYVDFGDRWVHVRRSNTEPVLRVIAEAPTNTESQQLIDDVHQIIATESP